MDHGCGHTSAEHDALRTAHNDQARAGIARGIGLGLVQDGREWRTAVKAVALAMESGQAETLDTDDLVPTLGGIDDVAVSMVACLASWAAAATHITAEELIRRGIGQRRLAPFIPVVIMMIEADAEDDLSDLAAAYIVGMAPLDRAVLCVAAGALLDGLDFTPSGLRSCLSVDPGPVSDPV